MTILLTATTYYTDLAQGDILDHDLCDARNCDRLAYAIHNDFHYYCKFHANF